MSVGAIVALAHDLVITVGIYALSGFEVTPATVTGILTILGLLALRHGRGVRQGPGEHQEPRAHPADLRRGGEPRGQPDPGALDQHLDRGAAPGRRAALRRRRSRSAPARSRTSRWRCSSAWRPVRYSSIFIATPLVVQLKELEPGIKAGDARAMRHRKRKEVDPLRRGAGLQPRTCRCVDEPGRRRPTASPVDPERRRPRASRPPRRRDRARYTAGERPASRPVTPSASAKRAQPSRKPRSQRGKQ